MADNSLNFLLSLASAVPGLNTGDGTATAASAPQPASSSSQPGLFHKFDSLLTHTQQQDVHVGPHVSSQGANSGNNPSSGSQNRNVPGAQTQNTSSQQNPGRRQADNSHNDNVRTSQTSSDSPQDAASNTQNDNADNTDKVDLNSISSLANALAAWLAFTVAPVAANQPQAPVSTDAVSSATTQGNAPSSLQDIVSTLQDILAQLADQLGEATQSGDTQTADASSANGFGQLLNNALQSAGVQPAADSTGQAANTPFGQLVASLQQALQPGAQNFTADDLQKINTLVTQFAAAVSNATDDSTPAQPQLPELPKLPALPALPAQVQDVVHSLAPKAPTVTAPTQQTDTSVTGDNANAATTSGTPVVNLAGTTSSDSGSNTDSSGQGSGDSGQQNKSASTTLTQQPLMTQPLGVNAGNNVQAPFSQVMDHVQQLQQSSPAQQLVAMVRTAAHNGESRIQIQLHPAELGWLDIRLEVTPEGHASMNVTTDNPNTLKMLSGDVKALTQMLTDIGLKSDAGSLSFNLRGDQQGQQGQNNNGQGFGSYRGSQPTALDEVFAQSPAQSYVMTASDGVDIRI